MDRSSSDFALVMLSWFEAHRRELPWRRDRDAYRIWVSEVMLQQTQVAAVVPFFERFLARFPNLAALAAADEHDVLRAWEGLGYYRRARHLHAAAKSLAASHGATLPDDPVVWAALPGIGTYMLGAVLSQAFDRRLPIVEANTQRVLSRLFAQEGDIKSAPVKKWLWRVAEQMVPAHRPGDFNQAMMELGALVCTPVAPKCGECPVADWCDARKKGIQDRLPTKSAAAEVTAMREVAVVVRREGRLLVVQRPDGVRWQGMWEFPRTECQTGEEAEASRKLLTDLIGIEAELGGELATLTYAVTRYKVTLVCREARYRAGAFASPFYVRGEWIEPARLGEYAFSTAQRKLAKLASTTGGQRGLFE